MAELKFNSKSPLGIVVGLLVLAGVLYFQFFMPINLRSDEKRAIVNKINNIRMTEMARLTDKTVKEYKASGKVNNAVGELKSLAGKVELKSIENKRAFFSGIKLKVTYTVDGNMPRDGGVIYFKLRRRKRSKTGRSRKVDLYWITAKDYK